ncbi:Phage gp6-like head-tail connector protein [Onishia taeanensis]|uniref:Phage gp6-like head-tail connector protein n=1 Tax=Onishia taeanensis TaxID=284577 RepID=A0A1G7N8P6_9GAMM|nr:head-tail connector protein [Halomonas taeanensis]SDF69690.1 Phage gp6-like head-tail connector protein [Halomonas taeanensis]
MLIPLSTIKTHLRLDPDPDSELDPELERLLAVAIDHASQYLGRSIPWDDPATSSSESILPASVEQALLILVAEYFENREQHVTGTIVQENPTVERLLHFYRIGLGI